jgi:hypothetical protein
MPLSGGSPGVAAGGITGQLLRKTSNADYAMEWGPVPATGGASDIIYKAPVPHASDDEFNDGVLSPSWTYVNGGGGPTITWTEQGDALSCKFINTNAAIILGQLKPISIGIGGYIQTAIKLMMSSNNPRAVLLFSNGTSAASSCVAMSTQLFSSTTPYSLHKGSGPITNVTFGAGTSVIFPFSPVHMRFTWQAANTWRSEWSPDGISWESQATGDLAATLAPTHMGFGVAVNASFPQVISFDYFRASA